MKAVIWTAYGPPEVLELREVEKPTPKDKEVLIKIHATTAFAGDCEMRRLQISPLFRLPMRLYVGWSKPKRVQILGQELAGEIESVGKDVTQFKPGDPVFGTTGFRLGAYAEYICLSGKSDEAVLAIKPNSMTYAQAAAVPVGGLEALHLIHQATIRSGERVLINGAGGSIGTFAIQLAKNTGAEVTAVDSARKLEVLRSIGADHVIDYAQQDFTKNGQKYDVIIDVVGKSSFSVSLKSLNVNGRYLVGNPGFSHMVQGLFHSRNGNKQVFIGPANQKTQDLIELCEFIEAGKLKTVMDRVYPLGHIVEAHRYVDSGQKTGNVILTVVPDN